MEAFLAEYGLSTEEGVALMCLAEALLRVPDAETIDELIARQDRAVATGARISAQVNSPLVNASTWALMLTGEVLDDEPGAASPARCAALRAPAGRAGDPHGRAAGDEDPRRAVRARPRPSTRR